MSQGRGKPYRQLRQGENNKNTNMDSLRRTNLEKDGKIIEYWAQLKDSVTSAAGFNFEEAAKTITNYDLIVKQCVDVEEITPNLISVDKSSIDALFDADETNDPTLGSEWQPLPGEEPEQTGGTEE